MKSRLPILFVFLLIPFTANSQDGSTVYPFNESQLRKLARLKIEYTFLLDENRTLSQMVSWCDSISQADSTIISELNNQLDLKDQLLLNRNLTIQQWQEKFNTADSQTLIERKRKGLYFITTLAALGLLVATQF